ncbi:hypothetical protein [Alkaliphilus transvaalensis]|uniref:hypothetical protein n=1 Tax=Alkaliphilus transvaalensis TaxID=114628 RepID=UPI00047BD5F9|nr:hypothetical protein [Alkaliphilus transvaalensis]
MNCINCENCKIAAKTYFCLAQNDFVIKEQANTVEKVRTGWKKGVKEYEIHRRKSRKEVEV